MSRRFHIATLYLALAAMILRVLLPAGWMPNFSHPSDSMLIICPMHGAPDAPSAPAPANHHTQDICPFASAAPLADSFIFVDLPPPSFSGAIPYRAAAIVAASPEPDYQAKAPRAPPTA